MPDENTTTATTTSTPSSTDLATTTTRRPGRRSRWRAPVVGLVMAATLGVTVALPVTLLDVHSDDQRHLTEVQRIEAFVERDRGLRFLRPVLVEHPDAAQLAALAGPPGRHTRAVSEVLYGLGRTPTPDTFFDERRADTGSVIGLYTENDVLYVTGDGKDDPYSRSVLAHELTHALDDQHFGLASVKSHARDDDLDAWDAARGLVEGDAERVRNDYIAALSPADHAAFLRERAAAAGPSRADSRLRTQEVRWAYDDGADFTTALARQDLLDAEFRDPPLTTQEVDQRQPSAGAPEPVEPAPLPAGDVATHSGRLGVHQLVVGLTGRLIADQQRMLIAAWRGDSYETWVPTRGSRAQTAQGLSDDTERTSCFALRLTLEQSSAVVDSLTTTLQDAGLAVLPDAQSRSGYRTTLLVTSCPA